MSTSYYRLRPPVTHLRLEDGGKHNNLYVWVDSNAAGILTLLKATTRDIMLFFALREADDVCPLRIHYGGPQREAAVIVNDESLPDEATVISEYGELLTVGEIKAQESL